MEFVDIKAQYKNYESQIIQGVTSVLQNGHFILGPEIEELEQKLCDLTTSKYCLATSSGTDSLMLALSTLDIGAEDEVICVPFTWISPVEAICRVGARPVFVDIDPETFVMDADQLEKAITKKTKAIITVSLYGQMPDFNKINEIAARHKLHVIEDAAQSFGAKQNGVNSCNASIIGVTSFFPTKPLGCYGDGGALFTNDTSLYQKAKALRVHGAPERYNHQYIGMNGRMDTLQAAILLAKLPFFLEELEKIRAVAAFYDANLQSEFQTPKVSPGNTHTYAQYVLKSEHRSEVMQTLTENNIPCAVYYPICIHEQPAYQYLGYKRGDFPVAEKVASEVFCVPMHPWLQISDLEQVVKALKASTLQIA